MLSNLMLLIFGWEILLGIIAGMLPPLAKELQKKLPATSQSQFAQKTGDCQPAMSLQQSPIIIQLQPYNRRLLILSASASAIMMVARKVRIVGGYGGLPLQAVMLTLTTCVWRAPIVLKFSWIDMTAKEVGYLCVA